MKLAWLIALVLMLIGFAVLFRPPRIDETMAPPVEPTAPRTASTPAQVDEVARVDDPARSVERTVLPVLPGVPAVEGPRTLVTGHCVDETGRAVADVELTLDSVGERWSASVSAPFVIVEGRPQLRFRAKSGADGRFRFDVPSPDATSIQLVATPGPERVVLTRTLEHVIGGEDVDLGDLRFAAAGRIAGRVHTSAGDPVAGVYVRAWLENLSMESRSDHVGRLTLGHLVAGTWSLNAESDRHLITSPHSVEVSTGGGPAEIQIIADPTPVLDGRVVDPDGEPIVMASVQAGDGFAHDEPGDSTRTALDGRFELHLKSTYREPFTLSVDHPGFMPEVVRDATSTTASGLVVVMQRSPHMTFRVVDARTAAAVLRYRIQLVGADSTKSMDSGFEEEDHPRGEAALYLDSEHLVVLVGASGHARLQAPVAADDPGGSVQTLRMSPGSSISGRALIAGVPAAGIDVHAARVRPRSEPPDLADPTTLQESGRKRRGRIYPAPDEWPGRERTMTTEADGRFRFDELPRGSWIVSVAGIGLAARSFDPIDVEEGASFEMGDVRIDASAGIEGRLLLPEGVDPRYARVVLDRSALSVTADEHGAYRFEGLRPGLHRVEVLPEPRFGIDSVWNDFELAANERKHVDIELRDSLLAHVHVRVTFAGAPFPAAVVSIESTRDQRMGSSASVDRSGEAELCAPARVPVRVDVSLLDRIMARSAELTLGPGEHGELEIKLEPGRLEVVLPERIQPRGVLSLVVDTGGRPQSFRITAGPRQDPTQLEWNSSHILFGPIAPGMYSVVAFQRDDEKEIDAFRFEGRVLVETSRAGVVDFSDK